MDFNGFDSEDEQPAFSFDPLEHVIEESDENFRSSDFDFVEDQITEHSSIDEVTLEPKGFNGRKMKKSVKHEEARRREQKKLMEALGGFDYNGSAIQSFLKMKGLEKMHLDFFVNAFISRGIKLGREEKRRLYILRKWMNDNIETVNKIFG